MRYPRETIGFAIPRRVAQGIRARLGQLCVGCEVVVGIFKPSERNPRVVGTRFVLVEMPTVIGPENKDKSRENIEANVFKVDRRTVRARRD